MNKIHSLSAFGLIVFAMWAFSTSQTLGAAPTCPCSPESGTLATAMAAVGFPAPEVTLPGELIYCDTHPMSIPLDPTIEAGAGFPNAVSVPLPLGLVMVAGVVTDESFGFCDFPVTGFRAQGNLDTSTAWRCIRDLTDACRDLGY